VVKVAGCITCHKFDGPERLVGPSLWDIGTRQDKDYIRESILDPDKVVVSGFPQGVMKATLTSTGFYQHISVETLEKLVDYLATLKGKS
jgi:cytochrome c oxidase subunit 2